MAKTHVVVEAHLMLDEGVLNPDRVGPAVAKKIATMLEDTYAPKKSADVDTNDTRTKKTKAKEHTRTVHTLTVSYRKLTAVNLE